MNYFIHSVANSPDSREPLVFTIQGGIKEDLVVSNKANFKINFLNVQHPQVARVVKWNVSQSKLDCKSQFFIKGGIEE